ncbi:MAG: hypothetical protein LBB23_01020 [Rickettsiales bacterium]|jgi:hypothetical protein|nr:hypothetical protein [Rickettsiales bacterium]
MKEMMSESDYIAHKINKLRMKRNILFRAFAINYVAVAFAWMVSMMPFYKNLAQYLMKMDATAANAFILDIIGIWKVLGAVLFLIPALAIWWEMSALKKCYDIK